MNGIERKIAHWPVRLSVHRAEGLAVDEWWQTTDFSNRRDRIMWFTEGAALVTCDGKEYRLDASRLWLFPGGSVLSYSTLAPSYHYYAVFTAAHANGRNLFRMLGCDHSTPVESPDRLRSIFDQFAELKGKDGLAVRWQRNGLLLQIVAPFLKTINTQAIADQEKGTERFADVVAHINANLHMPLRTTDLARLCHMERSHFSRSFARAYGLPPNRFVQRRRIEAARELLVNTDLSLCAIAQQLGYTDEFYFSRVFKKWTGRPPSQFRLRQVR